MQACKDYELMIQFYLDGMLEPSEEDELKEHLAVCPVCAGKLHDFQTLQAHLSDLDEPTPENLHSNILQYVREHTEAETTVDEKKPIRFPKHAWKAILGVAACALIAVTALRGAPALPQAQKAAATAPAFAPYEPVYETSGVDEADSGAYNGMLDASLYVTAAEDYTEKLALNENDPAPMNIAVPTDAPVPLYTEKSSAVLPDSVQKWYLGVGEKDNLPEWIGEEDLLQEESEGETIDFAEFDPQEETVWVTSLEQAGFDITELTDRGTVANGDYVVMLFDWQE